MRHFWNLEHGAVGCAQRWRWRWRWSNRQHPRDSLAHVWVGRSDACRLACRRRSATTPSPSRKRQAASITQASSSKEINFCKCVSINHENFVNGKACARNCVCECVCMYTCVREREREGGRERAREIRRRAAHPCNVVISPSSGRINLGSCATPAKYASLATTFHANAGDGRGGGYGLGGGGGGGAGGTGALPADTLALNVSEEATNMLM